MSADDCMLTSIDFDSFKDTFDSVFPHSTTSPENLRQPDIILVQAPGWGVNTPPLALAMLSAFARNRGFKVLPLDLNLEFYTLRPDEYKLNWEMEQSLWFWSTQASVCSMLEYFSDKINDFIKIVLTSKATTIGFTVYESSLLVTLELARRLKSLRPELVIILGGPHVSRNMCGPQLILDKNIDVIALGEGENTLVQILDYLKAGRDLRDCPGLLLCVDGAVFDTGDRELIHNLDDLPPPDFSDFSFPNYRIPNRLPLMGSRGCPNHCIYCNERPFWRKFRSRSAESIFLEIHSQIQRYPFLNFVEFQDSLVNGKISVLEKFAELLLESRLKIQWTGQAVIRKEMTLDLLLKLKHSGCVCLAYGLETPSPTLMRFIGKYLSKGADINELAKAHGQSGLGAVYNIMFGLPGETEEDSFSVLEFLRFNHHYGIVVNPSACFCAFSAGTYGYESPDSYGIDLSNGTLYWETKDGLNTYVTRLKRFEDFCRLVAELGIDTTYPATHLLDRNRSLGRYYEMKNNHRMAALYYKAWLQEHPDDHEIKNSFERISPLNLQAAANPTIYHLIDASDKNWLNGVSRNDSAFFVFYSETAASDLKTGRQVIFADGTKRTITSTMENQKTLIVYLDGPPLDGGLVGYPAAVRVVEEDLPTV